MTSGDLSPRPDSTHWGPQQGVHQMVELLRDVHNLLESYAPIWYTEEMDTRLRKTLAMFTLARTSSQGSAVEDRWIQVGRVPFPKARNRF
jgi:hypothetical protein